MTTNPWIKHVQAFAKKHKLTYFQALRHANIKDGYKPKKGGTITPSQSTESRLNNEMNRMIFELRQLGEQGIMPWPQVEGFQMRIYDLRINRQLSVSEKYDALLNIYKQVRRAIGDTTPEAF
jgi:hypothetical protein